MIPNRSKAAKSHVAHVDGKGQRSWLLTHLLKAWHNRQMQRMLAILRRERETSRQARGHLPDSTPGIRADRDSS